MIASDLKCRIHCPVLDQGLAYFDESGCDSHYCHTARVRTVILLYLLYQRKTTLKSQILRYHSDGRQQYQQGLHGTLSVPCSCKQFIPKLTIFRISSEVIISKRLFGIPFISRGTSVKMNRIEPLRALTHNLCAVIQRSKKTCSMQGNAELLPAASSILQNHRCESYQQQVMGIDTPSSPLMDILRRACLD